MSSHIIRESWCVTFRKYSCKLVYNIWECFLNTPLKTKTLFQRDCREKVYSENLMSRHQECQDVEIIHYLNYKTINFFPFIRYSSTEYRSDPLKLLEFFFPFFSPKGLTPLWHNLKHRRRKICSIKGDNCYDLLLHKFWFDDSATCTVILSHLHSISNDDSSLLWQKLSIKHHWIDGIYKILKIFISWSFPKCHWRHFCVLTAPCLNI